MTQHLKPIAEVDITDAIFGPPPILEIEDAAAYEALIKRLSADIKPKDIIEKGWVRDLGDLTWEIRRWRNIKASLIQKDLTFALAHAVSPFVEESSAKNKGDHHLSKDCDPITEAIFRAAPKQMQALAIAEAVKEGSSIELMDTSLADGCFTMDQLMSAAFVGRLEEIERIDRLITTTENRRNSVYREIDRRRANLARAVLSEVEDAQFETVEQAETPSNEDNS
jgi:hypothetical protein